VCGQLFSEGPEPPVDHPEARGHGRSERPVAVRVGRRLERLEFLLEDRHDLPGVDPSPVSVPDPEQGDGVVARSDDAVDSRRIVAAGRADVITYGERLHAGTASSELRNSGGSSPVARTARTKIATAGRRRGARSGLPESTEPCGNFTRALGDVTDHVGQHRHRVRRSRRHDHDGRARAREPSLETIISRSTTRCRRRARHRGAVYRPGGCRDAFSSGFDVESMGESDAEGIGTTPSSKFSATSTGSPERSSRIRSPSSGKSTDRPSAMRQGSPSRATCRSRANEPGSAFRTFASA